MGSIRQPTLRKLIAEAANYALDREAPIEPPPAELAPRLIAALPQIGALLESADEEVQIQALTTLARVWQIDPAKVFPVLAKNLHHLRVLYWTRLLAERLPEKHAEDESFIAVLIGYLTQPNSNAGKVAAKALAWCGPAAKAAIPALLDVVNKDPRHAEAALALWRIGRRTEALSGLIAGTKLLFRDELLIAIQSLGEIGPGAAEAGPALLALRTRVHGWADKRLGAAIDNALQKIGSVKIRMPGNEMIAVSPSVWPGAAVQPGDVSQVVPDLNGVQRQIQDPAHDALTIGRGRGGRIYFVDDGDYKKELPVVLRTMGVRQDWDKYAVFVLDATDPKTEGYVSQLRIVTHFALYRLFNAMTSEEFRAFPAQPLPIDELVCGFVAKQREEWNSLPEYVRVREYFGGHRSNRGKEELGFGFMVEDVHYGVYRIWSRAWLSP